MTARLPVDVTTTQGLLGLVVCLAVFSVLWVATRGWRS